MDVFKLGQQIVLLPIIENSFNLDIVIQDMEPENVKKKLLETLEKTEHMLVNNYNLTFSLMEIRENNDNFYISNKDKNKKTRKIVGLFFFYPPKSSKRMFSSGMPQSSAILSTA